MRLLVGFERLGGVAEDRGLLEAGAGFGDVGKVTDDGGGRGVAAGAGAGRAAVHARGYRFRCATALMHAMRRRAMAEVFGTMRGVDALFDAGFGAGALGNAEQP